MKSMKEMFEMYDGKMGKIFLGGLTINVMVTDVKNSYGNFRFRVVPLEGDGAIWVESVTLI